MFITKNYYPHIVYFMPIIFIVIGIVILHKKKNGIDIEIPKVVEWLFIVAGLYALVVGISNYIILYNDVYLEYYKGNYIECEGIVEDLELRPKNGEDSFKVDGVEFFVGDELGPGYQKKESWGGLIAEEGIYVKLNYVNSEPFNYIMEIEIQK